MFLRSFTLLYIALSFTAFGQTIRKEANRALAQDFCFQTNISGTLQDFICGSGATRGQVQLGPTVAALTSFSGHKIRGVSDSTTFTAGHVGEVIASGINRGSALSTPGGTPKTITSITVTPGDWEFSAVVGGTGSAISNIDASISITTNTAAGVSVIGTPSNGELRIITSCPSTTDHSTTLPVYRTQITSSTTYYLVGLSGATTVSVYGYIQARRMR